MTRRGAHARVTARLLASAAVACLVATSREARADDPNVAPPERPKDLQELSLDDLMNIEVVAPTKAPQPLRETPGVVTVITREEVIRSGARDLIDVLSLVPGFAFGVDVQNSVGVGFRGNWGHEGKVLVLLDGQEMHETLYLTTQFGNHFPIEQIQKIEIIRGPGSVVYGGNAELAVINIVTRGARDLDGVSASGYYGQQGRTLGRRSLNVAAGHVFKSLGDLGVSFAAYAGQGHRSGARYRDLYGNEYRLTDAGRLDPLLLNFGATWKGLSVRFIADTLRMTTRDAFDQSLPAPVDQDFFGLHFEVKYAAQLGEGVTATPRVAWKRQRPWRVRDTLVGRPLYYDKTAERWIAGTTLSWNATRNLTLLGGVETYHDRAWLNDRANVGVGLQRPVGDPFWTIAAFSQALVQHWIANVSLGARFEHNTRFGNALVPRAGITRTFGRFNAKLLFSQAFKAPGHENFALNPDIGPERTTVWEAETSYQLGNHVSLGANAFDITIRDPIVYVVPVGGTESYVNAGKTGTRGVEAEARFKTTWGWATLRYSFYDASGKNEVAAYAVPGRDDVLRAFPKHKVTLESSARLWKHLIVSPSAIWLGPRYGTLDLDPLGQPRVGREDPTLLLNLFVAYADLLVDGLELGAGVFNALDQRLRFLQPHDSRHAPLPGATREWITRLTYTRPFE